MKVVLIKQIGDFIPLIIILAESALELLPEELQIKPAVQKLSKKRNKKPSESILDKSLHHSFMQVLKGSEKRGRPDILHVSLLLLLGSILNKSGRLNVYIHTINNDIISIKPETRLPKNFNRFIGLMEQLFQNGQVPPNDPPLLSIRKRSLPSFLSSIHPSKTILFSETGVLKDEPEIFGIDLPKEELMTQDIACIVGAFPHGELSPGTTELADEIISIDPEPLETLTVLSKIVHAYEIRVDLFRKRSQI